MTLFSPDPEHPEGTSRRAGVFNRVGPVADTVSLRPPGTVRRSNGSDSLIGVELQGYVILRAISSGGMGVVYEARHPKLGTRAAVKVLRPEYSQDHELTVRFLREAHAISAIRHRNIVGILGFGALPSGDQYLMMEFLEGETLRAMIERSAPIGYGDVLEICDQLLCGLDAAHQAGVVHRDLKPANIILGNRSTGLEVKVCDFGLARQFDTGAELSDEVAQTFRLACVSNFAGTPEYLSPEQAWGRPVDGQADLYCLGVLMFEMLTGRLPFESTTAAGLLQLHREEVAPRVSQLLPDISFGLDALVAKLLEKAPRDRPAGASATRKLVDQLRKEERLDS